MNFNCAHVAGQSVIGRRCYADEDYQRAQKGEYVFKMPDFHDRFLGFWRRRLSLRRCELVDFTTPIAQAVPTSTYQ